MTVDRLPASASWRHVQAREGFESTFFRPQPSGYSIEGHTTAVEQGEVWAVRYAISLDDRWITRGARIWGWAVGGERETRLDADGLGHWEVDGTPRPEIDGCLDVDLESSACTNMIPLRRLELRVGQTARAPAAYVRARDVRVERLEQTYTRLRDDGSTQRYQYRAPGFDFESVLVYDACGVTLDYPGIATRAT